eukprot:CAMPEP_0168814546 /NCGR_PEP_ID=MMETSP0726-20121227/5734_1 /TAXON_ID=265536 /ORGANISM="Amphiprora sp., Strain CCMP467" /LENGTH=292 /DNA_ID=CAMNT_0008866719 /DNA_START=22 /DNA_END=900 /DNA_ORIENTATION=+
MSSNNSNDPAKKYAHLPLVPESTLRKRHDLDALARKRAAKNEEQQPRKVRGKKAVYVVKPETFISRSRSRLNHAIRYKRVLKKGMQKRASNKPIMATKEIEDPNNSNNKDDAAAAVTKVQYQANSVGTKHCVFVIRVRDSVGLPRRILRILDSLRLKKNHDAVFVNYDDKMRRKLHCIEPWVIYGVPSKAVVTDLISRRGFGTVDGNQRVPLSDNVTIENALGEKHGLICVEDLVHEVYNVGPAFEPATQFLWPFVLADSKTRFQRKTLRLKDGKEYGDQGEAIDQFIKEVL